MNKLSNREKFEAYVAQTSPFPPSIEVERGHGCRLFAGGIDYLDFISGIAVTNVGHCEPRVTQAVVAQAHAYAHTMVYGEHIQAPQVELAEAIVQIAPGGLNSVYFLTTGAEANDAALKLAAKTTGRSRFVAFQDAYHGDTVGALSCFGSEHFRNQFPGLQANVAFLPFGDLDSVAKIDESVAAVLIEPVQGEAGIIPPPQGFLQAVRARCTETGALLIFDEVQTGFGRTGQWFASQTYGVTPDVITMAKGMGAGYPLAGVLADKQLLYNFAAVPAFSHITTFGGHPVSCAAGLAGIQVIQEDNLLENCRNLGKLLIDQLELLKARNSNLITEVRGVGLMIGAEMATQELARHVVDDCKRRGLILETTLLRESTIRFSPPLSVSRAECETALATFESVLSILGRSS
jgi:acetylornithine/succinyldiaminopimelate/putrescine aminotransferase